MGTSRGWLSEALGAVSAGNATEMTVSLAPSVTVEKPIITTGDYEVKVVKMSLGPSESKQVGGKTFMLSLSRSRGPAWLMQKSCDDSPRHPGSHTHVHSKPQWLVLWRHRFAIAQ